MKTVHFCLLNKGFDETFIFLNCHSGTLECNLVDFTIRDRCNVFHHIKTKEQSRMIENGFYSPILFSVYSAHDANVIFRDVSFQENF